MLVHDRPLFHRDNSVRGQWSIPQCTVWGGIPANGEVFAALGALGPGHVRKKAVKSLRGQIQAVLKGGRERGVGKVILPEFELAKDLKAAIERALPK